MQFSKQNLRNGLKILTAPMPALESVTVTVWVKTGSRNEELRVGGISHFLEHMVFKGSKKRPSAKAISQAVDSIGGEFNAATSKDWTNFYIKASKKHLDRAMDVLSDMVLNPLLKTTEIEREKGTIIQEIAMYEDTPMIKIGEVYEEVSFPGNPLGRDTAGTPKSVKSIKRDDFVNYRETHYYPENMLVTVAGGVSSNMAVRYASNYFSKFPSSSKQGFEEINFDKKQSKPQVKIQNKESEQAHFILGYMGDPRGYNKRFAQSVLSSVLGGGMSSRMFTEVRERRGLAYAVKTTIERYQDTGYLATYVGTDPKKVSEAIKVVLDQYRGLAKTAKYKITNTELSKAKEYIKGHIALSLEDTAAVNTFFGEQELFLNDALTPEQIYKKIDNVSLEDVYAESEKLFDPNKLNLAIIGPFKDEEKFIKLLK